MPIYVLTIRYLSYPEILMSWYLFVLCIATMIGSLFPDIDWKLYWLGLRHRDPMTHSFIVPLGIFIVLKYYLPSSVWLVVDEANATILLHTFQAFLIGVASHLLGDNIKTGNLVKIPAKYEKYWYTVQGVIVIYFLYLTNFFNAQLFV